MKGRDFIFKHLSEEEQETLFNQGILEKFEPEAVIIKEGEKVNGISVIVAGMVRVEKESAAGFKLELARLQRGEIFGEVAFIDQLPASATVTAEQPTRIRSINFHTVEKLLETNPDVFGRFYQSVAVILAGRLRQVGDLFSDAHKRYVSW